MAYPAGKVEKLQGLQTLLEHQKNFIIASYSGLNVSAQNELRSQVKGKNGTLKVVKNRLFHLALKQSGNNAQALEDMSEDLKGSIAVIFVGDDFSAVSQVFLKKNKELPELKIKSGYLDGAYLSAGEVKELAALPSRAELLTIIGRGLNTPATKIALGINTIISSVARGIKAIGERNG